MRKHCILSISNMWKILFITFMCLWIAVNNASAQVLSWEEFVERMSDGEESENATWEYIYEDLAERHAHPFNIQTLTREQLETLPFLSPVQIENLLAYLYSYAPVLTLSELQLVEGLDYDTRAMLSLFLYVGEKEDERKPLRWKNLIRYGKNELVLRSDIPFYYRKGYYRYSQELLTENPNRRYLGDHTYQSFRYQYAYGNRLAFGLVGEKDAGEPFINNGARGYDFYSWYFHWQAKEKQGLREVLVGNYRANFGLGMVLNSQFGMGKQSAINMLYNSNKGIKKHASTNENDFFRGVAASAGWKKVSLTGFYSFRKQDANVNNGFITSLKTDGYHRTYAERKKKHNISNHLVGMNIAYSSAYIKVGATAVYNVFDYMLKPTLAYKRYDPSGREFFTLGTDYRFDFYRLSFIGETGVGKGGGVATLNSLVYRASSSWSMVLLHRYYARNYSALYARSFEEGGQVRNEHGIYLGTEADWTRLKLTAYVDVFRFPYIKYRVSIPGSNGIEASVQLEGDDRERLGWLLRYRYKCRGRDNVDKTALHNEMRHTAKGQVRFPFFSCITGKTTLDYVHSSFPRAGQESGWQLGQSFAWRPTSGKWQCEGGGTWFHTDSYATRVYGYERGMLYSFAFPSYYGRGLHAYLWGRYDINKLLTCLLKYSWTGYFDREKIGTGLQEIEGRHKQDLYLQLRVRF